MTMTVMSHLFATVVDSNHIEHSISSLGEDVLEVYLKLDSKLLLFYALILVPNI